MRTGISILLASGLLAACSDAPVEAPTTQAEASAPAETEPPTLEVIATGANIAGANGIHFGPDGLLYIASVIGSDLTVIDPETGEEVKRYTATDGVIGPDDVAFASDGSFYWTSILTGEVAGFNTDGEKIIAAQLSPGSNPITFSNDDRLFVSQCFLGTNLYELDPAGVEAPRLIADDLGPGCGLNGMDWGPDDRLYGPRWFVGEVVSYDVDTNERRVEATGFSTPAAIKFDSQGVLHVLDTATGELIRVQDGTREVVATFDPGLDNFAFDANDTAYVSSFVDGFIKRVNEDGSITTLQPGGLSHPGG
ncbi:MAG: WD40 repeat domain-containing protein, partial [Pseudomonadota bacterium]